MICMRGELSAWTPPPDLLERMLDYVIHVMATLALLIKCRPGEDHMKTSRCYVMNHGSMFQIQAREREVHMLQVTA